LLFKLFDFVGKLEDHFVVDPVALELLTLFVLDAAFAVHFVLEPVTFVASSISPDVNARAVSLVILVVSYIKCSKYF